MLENLLDLNRMVQRRRMKLAQRQYGRSYYVPRNLKMYWAMLWVGSVMAASSVLNLLFIAFMYRGR